MKTVSFFRVPVIFAVIFFFIYPFGSVCAIELSKDEQAYLRSKRTIVFVSQTQYPPFEFIAENGEHTGMCIELARWIATELGFTAVFTDTYFKQAQEYILTGKADMLTSFFYSKQRDESFDFTQVMFEVPASIFVVAERTDIKDIQDLNKKRIAMQAGDYAKEFLESKKIDFGVVYAKNFAEATDLVIAGKADAIIGDEQIVLYHIFKNNLTDKIKKVGTPLYIGQNCMATKDANRVLVSILNKGIKAAQASGVLGKINRKWIGTRYTSPEPLLHKYVPHMFFAVGAILVLALLVWFWNIRLRQAVSMRTAELLESEDRYRTLTNNLNVGVYRNSGGSKGKFIEVNPAILKLFGYGSREEFLELKVSDLYQNPDDRKKFNEKMLQIGAVINEEEQLIKKDGTLFIASISAVAVKDEKGEVRYYDGIVEDITKRKHMEEALRESEEKYRTVLETSTDPIVVYDIEGKVTYFNPAFTRVFGWTLEERLGKKVDLFVPDEDWPETRKMIDKVLAGESFSGFETRRYTKEGNIIHVNMSASTYKDKDGNPIGSVINLRDISAQKRLEIQLQQAQKMEAMGTLAGGIAHDFNNLLMGIQGRTSLMLMDSDTSSSHFEHLKGIEDYVKSAADLTRQLLGFARGGKYEVKPIELNELVKTENRMFGRTRKEINIHEAIEENLWTVEVDQRQIEQVLLNIYVNAWHAMPGGGNLYIQTENIIIDEEYSKPHGVVPGNYVKISITDTGVGMDEATRQRIFDPFFTTKEMGRGTGLGLASAYGIIKNHNGFIDVYSEKGEGTTFNIYLPASEKEAVKEEEIHEKLFRGTETLLLVDDEDMIIDVGCGIIEKLGYKVLAAKSGNEAIAIYQKNKANIDLLILDMIMPDMGGGETYDKLKEINPDIKVILSSGYSINGLATEILERGCNGFIQKPFKLEDLSKKIRDILDKE
ncbi:PAS domain S-box protein [Thermodesulfobacteriota bacterium]